MTREEAKQLVERLTPEDAENLFHELIVRHGDTLPYNENGGWG